MQISPLGLVPIEILEEILIKVVDTEEDPRGIIERTHAVMVNYFLMTRPNEPFSSWCRPLRAFVWHYAYNENKLPLKLPPPPLTLLFCQTHARHLRHLGLTGKYRAAIFAQCVRLEKCYLNAQVPTVQELEVLSKIQTLRHLVVSLQDASQDVLEALAKLKLATLKILRCNVSLEPLQKMQFTKIEVLS